MASVEDQKESEFQVYIYIGKYDIVCCATFTPNAYSYMYMNHSTYLCVLSYYGIAYIYRYFGHTLLVC